MIRGQMEWRGVTFGPGTGINITRIRGLDDLPDADYSSEPRARQHGSYPGSVLARNRVVEVTFSIVAEDSAAMRKVIRDATAFGGDDPEPLTFMLDGTVVRLNAQVLRRSIDLPALYEVAADPVVQWECPDPRRYGVAQLVEVPFPDAGDGLAYPFTYPSDYLMGEPGERAVTNAGSTDSPVIVAILGMANVPFVEFILPSGQVRRVDIDLTIADGEPLILDSLNNTATVGGANRKNALSGALVSELFLPPGTTTVRWGAFSGVPTSPLTVAFADAEM